MYLSTLFLCSLTFDVACTDSNSVPSERHLFLSEMFLIKQLYSLAALDLKFLLVVIPHISWYCDMIVGQRVHWGYVCCVTEYLPPQPSFWLHPRYRNNHTVGLKNGDVSKQLLQLLGLFDKWSVLHFRIEYENFQLGVSLDWFFSIDFIASGIVVRAVPDFIINYHRRKCVVTKSLKGINWWNP